MPPTDPSCPQCPETSVPSYDHIHRVEALPRRRSREDNVTVHGYVVQFGGRGAGGWVFFLDLEPALAFGRAGRMSAGDISSYGVYAGARELTWEGHRDILNLYISGELLDRRPGETEALTRWLSGVSSASSHYQPPSRR